MNYLDILVQLRKIIRSINLESKKIEKKYGISIPQLLCLQFLVQQPLNRASASQIKDFIKLNASTVSGIIRRLANKGLVEKKPNEFDRRSTYVVLTNKGLEILNASPTTLQERVTARLSDLSDDKIEELHRNIDLLVRIMGAEDLEAAPVITLDELAEKSI